MALKPVTAIKEEFINKAGKKTLPLPKGPRVRRLSDPEASTFKGLAFGPTGSGKTYLIVGLLLMGYTVFVITTDLGGDGLSTVELALKDIGRPELLERCISVVLNNYKEVETFLDNPAAIYPEIYDENIDFLIWDGFTGFQQTILGEYIGDMTPERRGDKEVSDARDSGLQFEQQDWGMVRNGTIRNLDKFLKLNCAKTGKIWHKWVTCLEDLKPYKASDGTTAYKEARVPMLQGAAKNLIGPAFDLIINTRIMDVDKVGRQFKYVIYGADSVQGAKTRGLKLENIEDGDPVALWTKIAAQKGIIKGAVAAPDKEQTDDAIDSNN